MKWHIYAIEASLLGLFMVSACTFGVILEHPSSPVRQAIENGLLRRALMGMAMGLTALSLIYSRWGMRSGAHMNPAVTLSFLRLGRITPGDAALFAVSQFLGAIAGVLLVMLIAGSFIRDPHVNFVATQPGQFGLIPAWIAEFCITFVLMNVVLTVNRIARLARFTGCFAALLVMLYITFEAPISGMSMNPARTLGSAAVGHVWTALWIYFTAPPLGMLAAVELQRLISRSPEKLCGKLSHSRRVACIFKCSCLDGARTST